MPLPPVMSSTTTRPHHVSSDAAPTQDSTANGKDASRDRAHLAGKTLSTADASASGNEWAASASRTGGQAQIELGDEIKKILNDPAELGEKVKEILNDPADIKKMTQTFKAEPKQRFTTNELRYILGKLGSQEGTEAQEATPEHRMLMDNLMAGIDKLVASASEESATEESIENKYSAV